MDVVWTARFDSGVRTAFARVLRADRSAAGRLYDRLDAAIALLAANPGAGRPYTANVRVWSIRPYRIFYRVEADRLELLVFWHARRQEPEV